MIYNFCGETKGKTSSALGTVLRALGHGQKVRIVFFMKHWQTSESNFLDKIGNVPGFDVAYYKAGDNDFIFVDEETNHATMTQVKRQLKFGNVHEKDEADIKAAQMGYMKAVSFLEEGPFLLVLDEINLTTAFGLLSVGQVRNIVETAKSRDVHVILTGRNPPEELLKLSDLITRMEKVKHPFDKGVYAVKGLDY
ncbi:cob(I)yrinic acid a,c-diamide adenosyltransferase [Candidatus Woesearchaeota archaeon]|nr:cob(I)yrinic acid a,c-diamide adenosyltransferase [Candidatus Woesearchaeota archaeon]